MLLTCQIQEDILRDAAFISYNYRQPKLVFVAIRYNGLLDEQQEIRVSGCLYFFIAAQPAQVAMPMLFKWDRQLGQSGQQ